MFGICKENWGKNIHTQKVIQVLMVEDSEKNMKKYEKSGKISFYKNINFKTHAIAQKKRFNTD